MNVGVSKHHADRPTAMVADRNDLSGVSTLVSGLRRRRRRRPGGLASRLSYLAELGIDAIWLSPIFRSPMKDFGYDISNYVDIDPMFGTMADFDTLLAAAHEQGLRLLLDLVPNHTSDQHPWFVESRSSRRNARREWYLWRDQAPNGGPPNNWLSEFGGSAWQFDAASEQYYYHAFLAEQPDLNWRNPAVVEAMHDVMRFWLRKGVDGFRVDVIWHLIKDAQFRDNPENPRYVAGAPPNERLVPLYTTDLPEVHNVIRGLRQVIDEFPERLLIGEVYLPLDRLVAYYGSDLGEAHLPFNFSLLETRWHARDIAKLVDGYEAALPQGGWPNWVLGNHDRPRIATRVGSAQARIAAMLLLTLRGTPTIYYGDEIGLPPVPIPPDRIRDPFEKNVPALAWVETVLAPPCSGIVVRSPDSRAPNRGFHSQPIGRCGMLTCCDETRTRSI